MHSSCPVKTRIDLIRDLFAVDFISYGRGGTGIVVASGAGLGLSMMDVFLSCEYFIDIDRYRNAAVDWEAIAVLLSGARPRMIVMVGWFTIDRPISFDRFERGVFATPLYRYDGGSSKILKDFIESVGI